VLFLGVALAVLGLALAVVSGLADLIGVGANEDEFGWKQIVGLIVGFAAIDVGGVLAWLGIRQRRTRLRERPQPD
jgi:predicted MFS family arabinose efflux permease